MKKNNGFTLAELLISIAVLSVLIITILPAVKGIMPNQNKMMMKKAYYTTSEIVSDMINDATLYPTYNSTGNKSIGFENISEITVNGTKYSGEEKFIRLFINFINPGGATTKIAGSSAKETFCTTNENNNVTCSDTSLQVDSNLINICDAISGAGASVSSAPETCISTSTKDGMTWYFGVPTSVASVNTDTNEISGRSIYVRNDDTVTNILVDVNGNAKPNCYQGSSEDGCSGKNDNFDQFRIKIYMDGSIKLYDEDIWATEAITVSSKISN